ncbi:MAG TPA: F0F1 ATP synthase subunit A [Candidatus Polarisedimenticolaceae bacterium]|nr:F0F1 ATP synthase subunit A [Candidatus Polarisedimenticolaceae bacterium]
MINVHINLPSETVFHIGSFAVTNSILAGTLITVILAVTLIAIARRTVVKPGKGLGFIVETIVEAIIEQMTTVFESRQLALKFFPLIATFFFFILVNNWLGLIPGFSHIMIGTPDGDVPLLRRTTSDLNTTIALALISFFFTMAVGYRQLGVGGTLKRYFHGGPMMWGVGVMEMILEFTRILSFSFRLFGNIFAGEVLLIVISALVPVLGPTPFLGFEIFVGAVQAFVFSILTLVFIKLAITPVTEEH